MYGERYEALYRTDVDSEPLVACADAHVSWLARRKAPPQLITAEEVPLFSFKEYGLVHFQQQKSGFLRKKDVTVGELLFFNSVLHPPPPPHKPLIYVRTVKLAQALTDLGVLQKPLTAGLHNLSPVHNKVAVEMSAKMLYHMEKGTSENFGAAKYIVRKGIAFTELRDECYCQLIRLTLKCPTKCVSSLSLSPHVDRPVGQVCLWVACSYSSSSGGDREWRQRIWELILYCCVSFEPSDNFKKYLASFLVEHSAEVRPLCL
jgi:hypothetical protein